ncbi:hypothetical protein GDO78_014320 [Eleutherodactylus coqui]|uniref:Uncharacterized protein n=1 Tax=Eleutherodactylus coqui TaxID=57060 RepID=A0A8J6EEP1_ELECQ|nr:hypothetical protein GDO78_014320 [Eleutherodactylus coqui]
MVSFTAAIRLSSIVQSLEACSSSRSESKKDSRQFTLSDYCAWKTTVSAGSAGREDDAGDLNECSEREGPFCFRHLPREESCLTELSQSNTF